MSQNLTLRDYLDAAGDAAKRTRFVIVVIVITSILTLAGFLNSLQAHWMVQRIQKTVNDPGLTERDRSYVATKFPLVTSPEAFESTKKEFYSALMKSYVDNTFTIKVPFFGITFDVNDLSLLSGLAFFILLTLFRFSLMREYENTHLAFEAAPEKELVSFYNLLAMRQVLTIPPVLRPIPRTQHQGGFRWATVIPKFLSFLPVITLTIVIYNDFKTQHIGDILDSGHTLFLYVASVTLCALVLVTTVSCLRVWINIDNEWHERWKDIKGRANITPLTPRTTSAVALKAQEEDVEGARGD